MKKALVIIGVIFCLMGLFQGYKYILDYNLLTEYGKGYVWGASILFVIGVFLIVLGVKKTSKS